MVRIARVVAPGYPHHVTQRGNRRQQTFFADEDYRAYLDLMGEWCGRHGVSVWAYCLMPNHYHLLIYLKAGSLGSDMMHSFSISYAKAVNQQQGRVGPLFQGRFQAKLVDNDGYLQHVSRYIHMNPVSAGLVERPEDWAYSSYRDYIGLRSDRLPAPGAVLQQFASAAEYRAFVEAYREEDVGRIGHLMFD